MHLGSFRFWGREGASVQDRSKTWLGTRRLGNLATPKRVQKLQTALHAKAKAEAGYRFYALYDKISREDQRKQVESRGVSASRRRRPPRRRSRYQSTSAAQPRQHEPAFMPRSVIA